MKSEKNPYWLGDFLKKSGEKNKKIPGCPGPQNPWLHRNIKAACDRVVEKIRAKDNEILKLCDRAKEGDSEAGEILKACGVRVYTRAEIAEYQMRGH